MYYLTLSFSIDLYRVDALNVFFGGDTLRNPLCVLVRDLRS
jgi:hypothetical protein